MDSPTTALTHRFSQPKAVLTRSGVINEGIVIQPGSVTLESATLVNRKITELQKRAQALGIPRLRGVRYAKASSYNANMGDGILGISIDSINATTKALDIAQEIKSREASIVLWSERLKAKGTFPSPEVERNYIKYAKDKIAGFEKEIAEIRAGRHPSLFPKSNWKKGDPLKDRPFTVGDFFPRAEKFEATLEHEFGHHVHQTLDVKTRQELVRPALEQRLTALRAQHGTSGTASRYGAGESARFKPGEWFAENYALWQKGRKDLVDDVLVPILSELDKRAGIGVVK